MSLSASRAFSRSAAVGFADSVLSRPSVTAYSFIMSRPAPRGPKAKEKRRCRVQEGTVQAQRQAQSARARLLLGGSALRGGLTRRLALATRGLLGGRLL